MPHGLGNPRDFDPNFASEPEAQPANPGANIRRIEDELEVENLGPEDVEVLADPFEQGEVGEYLGTEDEAAAQAELMQYLSMLQPPYVITPADLIGLVTNKILSVEEARTILAGHGVELSG